MKYNTQGLLRDWQHNKPAMQELARHAASKTAQKPTITAILTATNAERLLGCKVQKIGKQKLATPPRQAIALLPSLVEAMGDNVASLHQLLSAYYSNVVQREDYVAALKLGLTNMVAIDFLTDRHHKTTPASQRKLFQVMGRDDIYRNDKRILSDVARAVSLALFNRVSGKQLTTVAGTGLYLTRDIIRDCMQRPTEATDEQLSNALVLMRIAGYIHLAQNNELTDAGKKLVIVHDKQGKEIANHRVYVVSDFGKANWQMVQKNFALNLNIRLGHTVLGQLLGRDVVSAYFPDLSGGVTRPVIGFMLSRACDSADNTPIMTLAVARDTTQSIADVSPSAAAKYVDQCLVLKSVQATKMSIKEARENGYNLDEWQINSPAEKLIVPTNTDALMMCIERLKRANIKGVKVHQLLND
ncbi:MULTISPECIES: hypothetical protein [Lacticaseibacillus]|nr:MULTISPECIES: hypothetical protein [Lacticaseibacillus]QFQ91341.1 hypothetical protein LM010_07865 [Lacticaseibacillus manihotivorans]